jgi:hypothetical protein
VRKPAPAAGSAIHRVFEKARELQRPAEQAPKPETTPAQPATPPQDAPAPTR